MYNGTLIAIILAMKLYTYRQAARILGLATASGVARRLESLEKRGMGLSIEAGEMIDFGAWQRITEIGLARLREFEPMAAGRPKNTATDVH